MDALNKALEEVEAQVWDLLPTIPHAKLQHLLADRAHIVRAREIVRSLEGNIETANPALQKSNPLGLTRGDALVEILRKAGKPMHADQLMVGLKEYGFQTEKHSMVGIMKRDAQERFSALGLNRYMLSDRGLAAPDYSIGNGNGQKSHYVPKFSRIGELGITLKAAILQTLDRVDGEFDQPSIYEMLTERYPQAAPFIQKTSVSVTLNKLCKDGLLKETYEGNGRRPKRYEKVVKQESLRAEK